MAALLIPQSSPNPKAHGTLMKVKRWYLWDEDRLTVWQAAVHNEPVCLLLMQSGADQYY